MIDGYLSLNEAARRLNVSADTVRRMIHAGMQAERVGQAYCINATVLDEFAPTFRAMGSARLTDGQLERQARFRAEMATADCVNAEEAARIAAVDPTGLRRRIRAGDLPAERRGGMWWIKRDDLAAYMAAKATQPAATNGNGHRTPFVENGPATWAELHPRPKSRAGKDKPTMPPPPDSCSQCGRRCVTIGGKCIDCVWGLR